jgi:Txe/YoeB family toxin of Txe-Axe toxin-antitoxin module
MAKRTQILRVPQKKYTEETVEAVPVLGLPHENLIPPGQDAARSDGAHTRTRTGDAADETGPAALALEPGGSAAASTGDRETSGTPREGRPRPAHSAGVDADAGDTGHTGYTSIAERSEPLAADTMQNSAGTALKGRTRDVWNYFCRALKEQKSGGNRVRASRRQIQKESGVGSLNTIDSAIATLQGRGWLRVHPLPGSNEGYEYEVLVERATEGEAETPRFIAETLQRAASAIKRKGEALTPDHLNKWSRVAHQINRLVDEFK